MKFRHGRPLCHNTEMIYSLMADCYLCAHCGHRKDFYETCQERKRQHAQAVKHVRRYWPTFEATL